MIVHDMKFPDSMKFNEKEVSQTWNPSSLLIRLLIYQIYFVLLANFYFPPVLITVEKITNKFIHPIPVHGFRSIVGMFKVYFC